MTHIKLNKSNRGFSLIELSIVLIIIGLLVAGVTGSASLIQSAKITAFMNEVNGYKQSIYIFRAANDRLPGDLVGTGKIGLNSGQTYTTSSFQAPYNTTAGTPTAASAPFVDLYLHNVIDFKPGDTNGSGVEKVLAIAGTIPSSKPFPGFAYSFWWLGASKTLAENNWQANMPSNINCLVFKYYDSDSLIPAKAFRQADTKFDDGAYNKGKLRGNCKGSDGNGLTSYDKSVAEKQTCLEFNLYIL